MASTEQIGLLLVVEVEFFAAMSGAFYQGSQTSTEAGGKIKPNILPILKVSDLMGVGCAKVNNASKGFSR
jgi:hypothetical protein